MPYTTPAEVRGVLSFQGQTDSGSAAGVTDAQLQQSIEDARAEIDVRLAVRYPTPFDDPRSGDVVPVPPVVKRMNRDMAAYLATLTFLRGAPLTPDSPVALRNTAAQSILAGIAKGTVTLDLPGGPPADQPADQSTGSAVVNPYDGELFSTTDFDIHRRLDTSRLGVAIPLDTEV